LEDFDWDFVFFDYFLLALDLSDDLPSSEFPTKLGDYIA
jgi:hypothetical protein